MDKHERNKEKRSKGIFLAAVSAVVLLAVLGLLVIPERTAPLLETEGTTAPEPAAEVQTVPNAEQPVKPAVEFPLILADGKLEIESLFRFSGINPDCGNEEGEDVASVQVTNTSGSFLLEAKLTAELSDGTRADFVVTNLPAGKTAMAFAVDNTAVVSGAFCTGISCETAWQETEAMPEAVTVLSDGMTITLTNNTDQTISELIIYCRSPFDEAYYGGIAYEYIVKDLPAYGQATVEALDCIMGLAEAVRIVIK